MTDKTTNLNAKRRTELRSTLRQARQTAGGLLDTAPALGQVVAVVFGGLVALTAIIGLLWLATLIAMGIYHGAVAGWDASVTGWNTVWPLLVTVADAVTAWITTHAAGLPVPASLLLQVWAIAGATLGVLAALRSRGARIGWPLYGAATVAMAYFGTTTEAHRPVVAGAAALAWCAGSVLAFRRPLLGR